MKTKDELQNFGINQIVADDRFMQKTQLVAAAPQIDENPDGREKACLRG